MASKAIRGITIEIGGDTTKLGKAIESSEKQTRSLQTELRQVEKLLKFDPSNTELLAQKQSILAEMVEETSKKLGTLKEAEAQVVAQFERGEIGEEQLRAFQREIIQTEKNLGDMRTELSTVENDFKNFSDGNDKATKAVKETEKSVEEAKSELKEYGDKAKEAGEMVGKGILAIGTATVAGAGYALKLSTDFDKAFNTLQTRTGASEKTMIKLDEAMQNVYKNNFGESIEDVAESMAIVKNNTKASTKEIQGLTENALLLRDTFDFDVNESTRSAKMLMDQFGISGEEAYNLIAQGAQAGLDKNGDLLDTINEYSVHYEQLGFSSEEFINSLINGTASGTFSVDKLGDAMKEFGIRTKDTADSTTEGFKLVGLNADEMRNAFVKGGDSAKEATQKTIEALFNMDDKVKQNQAGVDLFGTMWEDLGAEGVKALMDVTGEADLTSDALSKINDQKYDDLGSAFEGLKRTLESDIIDPLGDELKPVVEEAISYVKENAPTIKDTISNLVTTVKELIGFIVDNGSTVISIIAGIASGLIAWNVASMISGVVSAIKAFTLANEGATVAQALFNAVLNANPIVLIVSLIAMLIAGIVTFIATNDDARAKVAEVWEAIKSGISTVIDAIVGFFTETIPNAFSSFVDTVSGAISSVIGFFKTLPIKIWSAIIGAISYIAKWGSQMKEKAVNAVSSLVSNVVGFLKALPGKIWSAIVGAIAKVATWGSNLVSKAKTAVTTMVTSAVSIAKSIPGKISSAISGAISAVATWGSNMTSKAKSAMVNVATSIKGGLKSVPSSMANIGKNIVQGLWKGITNAKDWVIGKIKGFGSSITKGIKSIFGIHSPSKVFEKEIGEQLANGLIKGVENKKENAKKSAKELAEIYISSAKDKVKSLETANKITEAGEVAFWTKIRSHTKKGTKAYKEATNELNKAKNTLNKSIASLDAQYAKDVKEVKTQLVKDIQAVTDEYDKAVSDRQKSIVSSLNLFDAFSGKEAIGKDSLTENLKSQVEALREWDNTLDALGRRSGMDSGLLDDLEGMGVDSLATLKELNSMSDIELSQYVALYKEKNAIALERSKRENEELKAQSQAEIENLVATANEQLNALEKTYNSDLKKLGVTATDQSKSIGKNIVKGLKNGISSQNKDFQNYLTKFFKSITSNAKNALKIHSPSRIFADIIGANIPRGIAKGVDDNADVATDSVDNLAKALYSDVGTFGGSTFDKRLEATFGGPKTDEIGNLVDLVSDYFPKLIEASKKSIVLDSGALVGETINEIDARLASNYTLRERGV